MSDWENVTIGEVVRFLNRRRITVQITKTGKGTLIADRNMTTGDTRKILRSLAEYVLREENRRCQMYKKATQNGPNNASA